MAGVGAGMVDPSYIAGAAKIRIYANHLAGCVGVASTIFSLEIDQKEDLALQVIETAERISQGMGRPR
jgi:DNA-binding IclR family transcriptional regulator